MERQKTLVIDASIIVKWFLNEENSDKALKIREEHILGNTTLIAPELAFLEVANTIRYKKIDLKKIWNINKSLWEVELKIQEINETIINKTIENSVKYNITIYDALYITIAQLHGVFMVTADKKLYKIPNVIALEKI